MSNKIKIELLLLILISFLQGNVLAQKKSKVYVERTKIQRYTESLGIERLLGDVIIRQEKTRFYCDSAYLHDKKNNFEAFGNVHIEVNDSVDVYGDRLLYEGNTRVAELFDNVKLVDKNTVLTTDHLVYNRNTKIAFYDDDGKIVSEDNNLTSKRGYYQTDSKIFYFRKDVVLINPDSEIYSDTLIYNTINKTAYFQGPTVIRSEESIIYTEAGWYNTETDFSKLIKRPYISSSEQTVTADSIYYNNRNYYGRTFGNVQVVDTLHQVIVRGRFGELWDKKGISYITDSALAITYDKKDSMYIHSDTMWMYFDKKRQAKKMLSYYNVRFYRDNMQGRCDSLAYNMADSTIRLYHDPVLWSGVNQLTADSINIVVANNQVDSLIMYNTAFIVSKDSTNTFNQIRGKNMVGYFKDNELHKISVDGNAQTVYYIREDDGYLIGVNLAEASSMLIRLKNNDVDNINYRSKPVEVMYPEKDLPEDMKKLKGFNWQEILRPKSKEDIFKKIKATDKMLGNS